MPKERKLNPKQEKFCKLYATETEFFGNGVESYIEAYDPKTTKPNWYKTAAAAASRMLKNVNILDRINELLDSEGFNDAHVDKQLLFLINQGAEFPSKLGAIKEYNKLKQRIVDRIDATSKGEKIEAINYIIPKENEEV